MTAQRRLLYLVLILTCLSLLTPKQVILPSHLCAAGDTGSSRQPHKAQLDGHLTVNTSAEQFPILWNHTYGGQDFESGNDIIHCHEGGFAIVGTTASYGAGEYDVWLLRVDQAGLILWNRTFGGPSYDRGDSLIECRDGGFAMAGSTHSYGAGSRDAWLIRTDANGNPLWNRTYGLLGVDSAMSIIQASTGDFILSGCFDDYFSYNIWVFCVDSVGDTLWSRTYNMYEYGSGTSIIEVGDGGYAITGYAHQNEPTPKHDGFLLRMDSEGHLLWNRTFITNQVDSCLSIVEANSGGFMLAGSRHNSDTNENDGWVLRTDANGNPLWNQTYGGTGNEGFESLSKRRDGSFALIGSTTSFGQGEEDIWVLAIDEQGNPLVNLTFGGTAEDYGRRILESAWDGFIILGETRSFGTDDLLIEPPEFRNIWLLQTIHYPTFLRATLGIITLLFIMPIIALVLLTYFMIRTKPRRPPAH